MDGQREMCKWEYGATDGQSSRAMSPAETRLRDEDGDGDGGGMRITGLREEALEARSEDRARAIQSRRRVTVEAQDRQLQPVRSLRVPYFDLAISRAALMSGASVRRAATVVTI